MRKIDFIKKSACIGAAVLLLGACGQADKADALSSETSVESIAEESSIQEEEEMKETTAAKEEDTDKDKEEQESETKEERTEEEDKEETSADAKKESSDANEEKSAQAEEESSSESKEETTSAAEETTVETLAPDQGSAKSVNDIYGEISQSVSLDSPMLVPDDFIMNYYGIDVSTLDEYVFSMSEAATSAETVVILKAKDGGSTGALSASLQTVIDQKRSEMENYLPDQFQIVDKSSVQVKGSYVYLVISEQADTINRIIQADIQ